MLFKSIARRCYTAGLPKRGRLSSPESDARILKTFFSKDSTTITFITSDTPNHEPFTVTFNNLFLRDSCKSGRSVDPASGQKLFTTGQLVLNPASTVPEMVRITPDSKNVEISWKDGDSYKYSLDFFYEFKGSTFVTNSLRKSSSKHRPVLWDEDTLKKNMGELVSTSFAEFLSDEKILYQALVNLQRYGLTFVSNIDKGDHDAVKKICERIGPIRSTFYGETFDVKNSTHTTSNIAYSNLALPFHQDLLYLENVPGFQLLHSIHNPYEEGDAGTSLFVDAFHAARFVREQDAEGYEAMQHVPVNYHYMKDGYRFYQSRPMVEHYDINESNTMMSNYESLIKNVMYSPPFQSEFTTGIYEKSPETQTSPGKLTERFLFRDFTHALGIFDSHINQPENQFKLKLPENTCVIFNNRRILHARTAFTGSSRWFRGCYLDRDSFKSKLKFLEEKY